MASSEGRSTSEGRMPLVVVWCRQSYRMADNALWVAASQYPHASLLCVTSVPFEGHHPYCSWLTHPRVPQWHRWGEATAWYAHGSLASLAKSLETLGQRLYYLQPAQSAGKGLNPIREETTCELLPLLNALEQEGQYALEAIVVDECTEPSARQALQVLAPWCQARAVTLRRFLTHTMLPPYQVLNQQGQPFKVFSPFWKTLFQGMMTGKYARREVLPAPTFLPPPPEASVMLAVGHMLQKASFWWLHGSVEACQLRPSRTWDSHFMALPGEAEAQKMAQAFIASHAAQYHTQRDFPALAQGTSKLSSALHFGEISPVQLWESLEAHLGVPLLEVQALKSGHGMGTFLREVAWREFAYYLLYHFPHTPDEPLNPAFEAFPWVEDAEALERWHRGQTGYPIVDAGMRELWHTGWMHNRLRMMVASFLVKDLRIHWREGARWFWDTLTDADLASNTLGWQWTSGCGADAAPYFRVFNPILQGKKFDADGAYVRRWIPELSEVPSSHIHTPWEYARTPKTYPKPIVDHDKARLLALEAFETIKRSS
ncbi:MAG: cryptochrome/photolyase family protein [Vampirovibrionales bacterium]